MWLVALSTFLTVTFIAWQVAGMRQAAAVPADGPMVHEPSAPKPIVRGDHRLDLLLERINLPFKAQEAVIGTVIVAGLAAAGAGFWFNDPFAALIAGGTIPLAAAAELKRRLDQHAVRLSEQLPDAMMMMANALKAGHTLTHAFQNLSRELPAPLGTEFARLVRALQMGQSPEAALDEMRVRVANPEMDMMVQAILIQRETGGNLAEILTNIQFTLRERTKLKGKVRSLTAQGKLSGVVIGGLPIALFLFLWTAHRPYLLEFLMNPIGQQCMLGALLGQITGFIIVHRIVNFPI